MIFSENRYPLFRIMLQLRENRCPPRIKCGAGFFSGSCLGCVRSLALESVALERAVDHPGNPELVDAHTESLREKGLAERHSDAAAFAERLELALGLGRIGDRQRDRKALRLVEVFGRRVRRHQHLAADRDSGMHDLLLPLGRRRHLGRRLLVSQHHLDFTAKRPFIVFERGLAISIIEHVGVKHRLLLAWVRTNCRRSGRASYCSAAFFRLASPASKSLPIILSKFMNTCIILDTKEAGPCITQVTSVAPPCGSIVNSAVL